MTHSKRMVGWVLLILAATSIQAGDPPPRSHLQVASEPLSQIERINGLPVQIIRFTGPQVAVLEHRWQREWQRDRHSLWTHTQSSGAWRIHSRVTANGQEVLQVRGTGISMELLWSRLEARARPVRAYLPAGCQQGFVIEGRDLIGWFVQATAMCPARRGPARALVTLRRKAAQRR